MNWLFREQKKDGLARMVLGVFMTAPVGRNVFGKFSDGRYEYGRNNHANNRYFKITHYYVSLSRGIVQKPNRPNMTAPTMPISIIFMSIFSATNAPTATMVSRYFATSMNISPNALRLSVCFITNANIAYVGSLVKIFPYPGFYCVSTFVSLFRDIYAKSVLAGGFKNVSEETVSGKSGDTILNSPDSSGSGNSAGSPSSSASGGTPRDDRAGIHLFTDRGLLNSSFAGGRENPLSRASSPLGPEGFVRAPSAMSGREAKIRFYFREICKLYLEVMSLRSQRMSAA